MASPTAFDAKSWGDEFHGRKVVLTGACGVLGRWIADALARVGARLCLSDREEGALRRLGDELGIGGNGGLTHTTELTDAASVEKLVSAVGGAWGAPDVVVNNAGVYPSGFLIDIDAAEWDRIFAVNLRAPFLIARGFAKQMIAARQPGNIINISSGAARKMRRTVAPYCISKTALDRLTKGFALELAEFGIRVNAVEPGFAPGSTASPLTPAHVEATLGQIPLGRGTTQADLASAILYLCSTRAGYITGATLSVDGGNSIGSLAVYQEKKRPG